MGYAWSSQRETHSPPAALSPKPQTEQRELTVETKETNIRTEKLQLVWLLRYVKPTLPVTVLRYICSEYVGTSVPIAAVNATGLVMHFDPVHRVWLQSFSHKIKQVSSNASFLLLNNSRLFLCDNLVKTTVYILNGSEVELKSRMLSWHKSPGLIYSQSTSCIFVFGGQLRSEGHKFGLQYETKSEKLFERSGVWRRIRDMRTPRGRFNPCAYQSRFYLIGGIVLTMETYDQRTDEYGEAVAVVLPDAFSCLCSTSAVARNAVLLIGWNFNGWMKNGTWSLRESNRQGRTWSNCPPVVCNGRVFLVNMGLNRVAEFDLLTENIATTTEIPHLLQSVD